MSLTPPQPIAVLVPALLISRTDTSRHGGRDGARHRNRDRYDSDRRNRDRS